jgi:hypothetical protein
VGLPLEEFEMSRSIKHEQKTSWPIAWPFIRSSVPL